MAIALSSSVYPVNTPYARLHTHRRDLVATDTQDRTQQDTTEQEPTQHATRKRRTFTLSENAYDVLTASAEAQGTNRSRLVEELILQEHRTVALTPEARELLINSAQAFGTEPERLAEELIRRCGAILASQTPEPAKPTVPWWMFWHRKGAGPLS